MTDVPQIGTETADDGGEARTLRRSLALVLVAVALLSVLLLGALNYWQARSLITTAVDDILISQQATRARAVRVGLEKLRGQVSVVAADPVVADAIGRFTDAFAALGSGSATLSDDEDAALTAAYAERAELIASTGIEVSGIEPSGEGARYLQYHYIVANPSRDGDRRDLIVAEDDSSAYGQVHAELHEVLRRYAASPAVGDLLLIDLDGTVVYSTNKRADLGTNLVSGPYRESALADAVINRVPSVPIGETVYVDFERYLPALGEPTLFAAAAVRSDSTTIGVVVVQIRNEALDALTTSNGGWESSGLGRTGEAYVVGGDLLMRTNSRLWIEDSETYLERLGDRGADPELGRLMSLFDSTVLIQPVDTAAVAAAFDGETFVGRSDGYIGGDTLAVASPVGAEQLNWVLVAAVDADEANAPLGSYVSRILLIALILVPIVALVGVWLSDRITRPARPIVDAAARVAGGDLDVELPDLGRNEFGDVARRLNTLTSDLRANEAALRAEEQAITKLLLSALPPRVVRRLQSEGRQMENLLDTATIVAIGVDGVLDQPGIDQDSAVGLSVRLSAELEDLAEEIGVERVRSSSAEHVFAAGLATPDHALSEAALFATEAAARIARFAADMGLELHHRIGMCSGEVVAALFDADQLTYGVVGDAVRTALALQSIAGTDQVLVCEETAPLLDAEFGLDPVGDLVDLRGVPVQAMELNIPSVTAPD